MQIRSILVASFLGLVLSGNALYAQTNSAFRCGTDEHARNLERQFPGQFPDRETLEQQIQAFVNAQASQSKTTGIVYQIPVVIHVVTANGCNGISKAQILNGLEVVNQDFRKLNSDTVNTRAIFKPYAADTEIEFVLARKDPAGGQTEGIVRVQSPAGNGPINRDDVKTAAPAWPTDKYFNIWIVEGIYDQSINGTVLGYAQFPAAPWNTYGVVLEQTQWGKQGAVPGSTAITPGHNASHEISHCFNLLHDFGCGTTDHCTSGDRCGDTPPTYPLNALPCDLTQNTCSNDVGLCSPYLTDVPDQIENFLSISDCQSMFTQHQKTRMRDAIFAIPQLSNLVSATNALVTGINTTPSLYGHPYPFFCISSRRVCEGTSVTFTDFSYGTAATNWSWTFPGGTPATSNAQNPTVVYNTPGNYGVTLTAGNMYGQGMATVQNIIKVVPVSNLVTIGSPNYYYEEGFEEASFPGSAVPNRTWENTSPSLLNNQGKWQRSTTVKNNGVASLMLPNASFAGITSALLTPNFAINGGGGLYLHLSYAYAPKNATPEEELRIYASTDCGATWGQPLKTLVGSQLVTNGGAMVSGNFTPLATEWGFVMHPLDPALLTAPHVMFKIETVSKGGNNLYIDNFIISGILGSGEEQAAQNKIKVYPNPATSETGIHFELKTAEKVTVTILDLAGKTVYAGSETAFSPGAHSLPVAGKVAGCKAGMYLVQVTIGGKIYNTRLLLQ